MRRTTTIVLLLMAAACDGAAPLASDDDVLAGLPPVEVATLQQQQSSELSRTGDEEMRENSSIDSVATVWTAMSARYVPGTPGLLHCSPVRYHSSVQIVGPKGADIKFGEHKLEIPKGALAEPVVITAEALVSTEVQVRLSPHGLTFAKPPKLTIDFRQCHVRRDLQERVAYTSDVLDILEWPTSMEYTAWTDDKKVVSWIEHFSRYAVAY